MDTTTQVPQEISALIAYAEEEQQKQELQKQEKALQEELEREVTRRKETEEFWVKVMPQVPDVIRPFVNLQAWIKDSDEYGYSSLNHYLRFDVPDLAPIVMVFNGKEPPQHIAWIVAGVVNGGFGEEEYIDAGYSLGGRYAIRKEVNETELRFVLLAAQRSAIYLQEDQDRKTERMRQRELSRAKYEAQQAQEKAEEQALFDALKRDDVAMHLLKAYILLRDERSYFETRLEEAGEELYSMENRWSRKAEELRRQADDAQRRADDDRMRLQSDLSEAEAQIKKMERGW